MDIWTLLRITARRWYVTLPIVALALWLGYSTAQNLPPTYMARSSAVITGPAEVRDDGETVLINPWLTLGGSLNATTQMMRVLMDSDAKREEHAERGIVPAYEVDREDAVLFFDVEGDDPDEVVFTASELVRIADEELALLQDEQPAAPERRAAVAPISVPDFAFEDTGNRTQTIAVAGALGLILGMAAAVLLDGLLRWRSRRADERRPADGPHDEASGDDALRDEMPEAGYRDRVLAEEARPVDSRGRYAERAGTRPAPVHAPGGREEA